MCREKNLPRQHHIVPVTYLKGFCIADSDRLAILDTTNGKIRNQLPSKVMRRRDYFRQKHAPEGVDEFIFELSKTELFESNLGGIIAKLTRGGSELSEDELIKFLLYFDLQRLTVPKHAEYLNSIGEKFITNVAMEIPEFAEGNWQIKMKDEFRFSTIHDIVKSGQTIALLTKMLWRIWDAPGEHSFITSDNPVVVVNPKIPPPKIAGIGLVGSRIYFPLTNNHCLELVHREMLENPHLDPLSKLEVEGFDVSEIQILAGRTMPAKKINMVNSFQLIYADLVLAGNNPKDLTNIYKALKTKENS